MYFSIVIPCYNAEKTLSRTLDSVIAQQDFVKEIILIDDGSHDQTQIIAKHYISSFPNCAIYYHYQTNQGPAKARNAGAQYAQGLYTLFLDNDDSLNHNALHIFQQAFAQNPEVKLLIAGARDVNHSRQKTSIPHLYPNTLAMLKAFWFGELSIDCGAAPVRTEILKTIKFPENIKHGEDIVFYSRVLTQYPAKIVEAVTLDSYRRPDSLRNQQTSILADGDDLTSILFDPTYLKPEYMAYRPQFHARNLITLARAALLLKQKEKSRSLLLKAFQSYPKSFLSVRTLKLYLKTFL